VGTLIRVPLQVLLPCLAACLGVFGAVAAGIAGVSVTSSYLTRQADNNLLACASSMLSHGFVAAPGPGPIASPEPPGACDMELLSASGQLLTLAAPGPAVGPAIPVSGSWLAAHLARPVTVPGADNGGRWRVVIEAVHYQPQRIQYVYGPDDVKYVVSGRPGHGSGGMLVVMAGLAGTGQIIERLGPGYAAAAGAVLVLLAGAALALTQAILRPLREAAGLAESAGQAAAGGRPHVIPSRGVRAGADRNRWAFGTTLRKMSEQLHASRTAEAAARRAADEMSEHLAEAARELLRSVNVVRGFADYYWQRGQPAPTGVDRMLRRVADEAARMETLIEGLSARSPRGSTAPDLQPTHRAAASDHPASRPAERSLCTPLLAGASQQISVPNERFSRAPSGGSLSTGADVMGVGFVTSIVSPAQIG
jgi:two-component system OmpR family sensor kinase